MCCSSIAQSQIKVSDSNEHSSHQDSSYHCAQCNHHLFDADEATAINPHTLHYHGVGTDSTETAIHCSACRSHLGYYNHQHNLFKVIGNKIGKEEETPFQCLSCLLPLFEEESLFTSNDSFHYFSTPIDKERIDLAERNQFYKRQIDDVKCRRCGAGLGDVHNNDSGGFGMRLNLGAVKKRKKK